MQLMKRLILAIKKPKLLIAKSAIKIKGQKDEVSFQTTLFLVRYYKMSNLINATNNEFVIDPTFHKVLKRPLTPTKQVPINLL